jgi:hypothetical protein
MVKSKTLRQLPNQNNRAVGRPGTTVNKIKADTRYEFTGRNMTPFGGLLPMAALLEKLEFNRIIETTLTVKRQERKFTLYQYVLAILIGLFIGLNRLSQLAAIAKDKMVLGILNVEALPHITSFWRFIKAFHIFNEGQLLSVNHQMMRRVWQSANIKLTHITFDHDTTVNTLYGHQQGARKGYNPKHKGKRSYQPVLTFIAETGEYFCGKQRPGDSMSGEEIAQYIERCFKQLPPGVTSVTNRADAGFYCKQAIAAFEGNKSFYIIAADLTSALRRELEKAAWRKAPECDGVAEFWYRPQGWPEEKKFNAIRYQQASKDKQPTLFELPEYTYRVFVTNLADKPKHNIDCYDGRASAENLIEEANNDAGVTAVPSGNFITNKSFFQLAMIAYNLNRWLHLFALKQGEEYKKRTLRLFRMHFLFIAAKIVRGAHSLKIKFSEDFRFTKQFHALMERLKRIQYVKGIWKPVVAAPFVYLN